MLAKVLLALIVGMETSGTPPIVKYPPKPRSAGSRESDKLNIGAVRFSTKKMVLMMGEYGR